MPMFSTIRRQVVDRVSPAVRRQVANALPAGVRSWYASKSIADADHYLLSPPKAGRTWLRTMLGRAIQQHYGLPDDVNLLELHELNRTDDRIPSIAAVHDNAKFLAGKAELDAHPHEEFAGRSVLLLVRDPRDVAVSMYFQLTRRRREFEGSLSEFLTAGYFDRLLAYLRSWADDIDVPERFCLVRYEDLMADPAAGLTRALEFFGIETSAAAVADAVAFGSFDNMRKLETDGSAKSFRLRPGDVADPNSFKTRSATVGGFSAHLSAAEQARCQTLMREQLPSLFGYETGAE
jgi:hypothetical protein